MYRRCPCWERESSKFPTVSREFLIAPMADRMRLRFGGKHRRCGDQAWHRLGLLVWSVVEIVSLEGIDKRYVSK